MTKFITQKVFIASDHAGFTLKETIIEELKKLKLEIFDLGCDSAETSVDYPDFAQKLSKEITNDSNYGILICGSGEGMQIAANKIKGIRAGLGYDDFSARKAREDNDSNILTLRAREFDYSIYPQIIDTFLTTSFLKKVRHKRRISQLE